MCPDTQKGRKGIRSPPGLELQCVLGTECPNSLTAKPSSQFKTFFFKNPPQVNFVLQFFQET